MVKVFNFLVLFFYILTVHAQPNDAELVSQETHVSLGKGKLVTNVKYEIKIYNRTGEKFTQISIPYSKIVKVSDIEASILDKDRNIVRRLKKSEITERSAISDFSLYEDNFIKEFTLKHNTYPYTVCYSYTVQEDDFLFAAYWIPVLDTQIPTLSATLDVVMPKDYNVHYVSSSVDDFKKDSTGGQILYSWHASYNKVIKPEVFSPGLEKFLPFVKIAPHDFKYSKPGSLENWQTYGSWQSKLLEGLSDLPQSEVDKIKSKLVNISGVNEKIKILYHYLQDETRYINITIKTGGFKPYPASYVAQNKYGDCKALTNYFRAVLNVAGIPSFYTKIYGGEPINEIDKTFPSPQFNHIILCIPLQPDTLWLDCTSDGPFCYLGAFTQNRDAFVINDGNSFFSTTPALSESDVLEIRTVNFSSDLSNEVLANFKNTYKGKLFESLSHLSRSYNESDKSQIIRNYFIEKDFNLIHYNLIAPPRDSTSITLFYSAKTSKIYRKYGNEILIGLLPFNIPQFEKPEIRKLPVQLDLTVNKSDTIEYRIPAGYTVAGELKKQTIASKYGRYDLDFIRQKNKVQAIKNFVLYPGKYSESEYPDFYAFIKNVNEIENNTFIVTNKNE